MSLPVGLQPTTNASTGQKLVWTIICALLKRIAVGKKIIALVLTRRR